MHTHIVLKARCAVYDSPRAALRAVARCIAPAGAYHAESDKKLIGFWYDRKRRVAKGKGETCACEILCDLQGES